VAFGRQERGSREVAARYCGLPEEQKTLQSTLPDYSVGVTDRYVKTADATK